MFLINGVLIGVVTFLPLFAQNVMGYSASRSGTIITPMMISMTIAMIFGGVIVSKTKRYKLQALIGIAIMTIGCAMLSLLKSESGNSEAVFAMVAFGIGAGVSTPIFTSVAQSGFSEREMGVVNPISNSIKLWGKLLLLHYWERY